MLVVVYDDHAYGAEVHHFGPDGDPLDTVVFPDTDLAAIARGFGFDGVTVRSVPPTWTRCGPGSTPVGPGRCWSTPRWPTSEASWWLEEAFRGH